MTRLSVNINKFATLRNARGANNPDLVKVAIDAQNFGAQGITIHPRPDQRHIRYDDVFKLKQVVKQEFNIEGNPTIDFIKLVTEIKPEQVTLVPDSEDVLTSNNGWDTIRYQDYLKDLISELKYHQIRVSIFCNAEEKFVEGAAKTGTDRIELYTGPYADHYSEHRELAIAPYIVAAQLAKELGLGVNAGHDLDLNNLKYFKQHINNLDEVSIGHALICDSLYYGFHNTIQMYLRELE
ncbi:MAG: pyridoxine 5'-phosphate synthase [Bacteroidetes bacterium]|nr:pyridoxine 5'-phosphate synthase [Bacteroidota bacterium]